MSQFENLLYTDLGMEPEQVERMQVMLAKAVIEAGLPEDAEVDILIWDGAVQVSVTMYRDSQKFRSRKTFTRQDVIERMPDSH